MDPRGEPIQLPGTPTKEPTFGLPAIGGLMEAASPEEANSADAAFTSYIMELIATKKAQRGPDLSAGSVTRPRRRSLRSLARSPWRTWTTRYWQTRKSANCRKSPS